MKPDYVFCHKTLRFYPASLEELYREAGSWPEAYTPYSQEEYEDFMEKGGAEIELSADKKAVWKKPKINSEMGVSAAKRRLSDLLLEKNILELSVSFGNENKEDIAGDYLQVEKGIRECLSILRPKIKCEGI